MASIRWLMSSRLTRFVCPFAQLVRQPVLQYVRPPVRALHRGSVRRAAEKNPLNSRARAVEQQYITELDKADALMLRKSHETGFLSWFRNGLLATGIGVIAFVQSDVGREAGYAVLLHTAVVSSAALFWLCAVSLYIGRLEVEIIHDEDDEEHGADESSECAECRARRDREKGQDK